MHAAVMRVDLRVPDVRSLKGKRAVVKPLVASIRKAFPVAVAEVDHQDAWQRATLGIGLVAADGHQLERLRHAVEKHLASTRGVEVLDVRMAYLEDPGRL